MRANLPYLVVIVVSLVVLVAFVALAEPFTSPAAEAVGSVSTVTTGAGATTTAGLIATTTTTPDTTASTDGLTAIARGESVFNGTCIACHGVGGIGVEGLGKPLTTSTFVAGLSDDDLLAFLVVGRADTDPLNTTGMVMPARGGNIALTDADLRDVIAYLRTLAP
jgi:mono/diheme cytochrome c family protein